jgi:hypothetical protein
MQRTVESGITSVWKTYHTTLSVPAKNHTLSWVWFGSSVTQYMQLYRSIVA